MFDLRDIPTQETLKEFAKEYRNPNIDALRVWLKWASVTTEMLNKFEANIMTFGLSQTQFFVLILLKRNPKGLKVGEMAKGTGITSQTMTRILDRMEKNELVNRNSDPSDRRAWIFKLSEKGDQLLSEALPAHYEWVANLMAVFTADEREELEQLMDKYFLDYK